MRPAVSPRLTRRRSLRALSLGALARGAGAAVAGAGLAGALDRGSAARAGTAGAADGAVAAMGEGGWQRHRRRVRDHGCRRCGAQIGWVKQEGVVPGQAASFPGRFKHEVDKGLVDWATPGELQIGLAIGSPLQCHADASQHRIQLHAGSAECRRGTQPDFQAVGLFLGDFEHFDLGPKRFAQRGLHDHPAQSHGLCLGKLKHACEQQCGSSDRLQPRNAFRPRFSNVGRGKIGGGLADVIWHVDLDVKNRELTLTSTRYSDKLRTRLSFSGRFHVLHTPAARGGYTTHRG